jgi:hypothetical protein
MRADCRSLRASRIAVAAGMTALGLAGCAAQGTPFLPASASTSSPTTSPADAVSVGVVGDSLASGGPWDAIPADPGSWSYYLDSRDEIVGGWRRDGATSALMADNLQPFVADVAVIMAGTNDLGAAVPPAQILDNVQRMVDKADVRGVVLCAVPPSAGAPDQAAALNTALAGLAREKGWTWVDPWAESRDGTQWRSGASPDGIHGTLPSYAQAAARIDEAIGRALEGTPTANAAE